MASFSLILSGTLISRVAQRENVSTGGERKLSLAENTQFDLPDNNKTTSKDILNQMMRYSMKPLMEVEDWEANQGTVG